MRHWTRPFQPAYKTITCAALLCRNVLWILPLFQTAGLRQGLLVDIFAVFQAVVLGALFSDIFAAESSEANDLIGIAGLLGVFV
jgi:hypothetical protein